MLAFYRKYRPASFRDMVGQDAVAEVFRAAGRTGKIAHAYILYGPRGTGKTTTARLIAKLANCMGSTVRVDGEPCNACRACAEIDEGRAMDVIEIDAASNRGIDEIRALQDAVRVAPSSSPHKVFIIDEAHMLTPAAWNALLKTLEEPPPHAILILATTEYEKIPATIASRSQRFRFRKIPIALMVKKLRHIADSEQLHIDDAALELIAAASEGAMRDAESLLDQVASLAGQADLLTVQEMLGKVGFRRVTELAAFLITGDGAGALRYAADLYAAGANVVDLNKELIGYLRRALALRFDPGLEALYAEDITQDELRALKSHSAALNPDKILALLKSLIRAYSEMRYSPLPPIPFEVAIIEHLKK